MRVAILSCKEIGIQGVLHNKKHIGEFEAIVKRPLPGMIALCATLTLLFAGNLLQ